MFGRIAMVVACAASAGCRWHFDERGVDASVDASCVPAVTATAVAAGDEFTCVQLPDGTLRCWGDGGAGELGDGGSATQLLPVEPTALGPVTSFATGDHHACAVANGMATCWGSNHTGQLGTGDDLYRAVPTPVPGLPAGITAVAAGGMDSCAVAQDGTLWCWGQVNGTNSFQVLSPVQVTGLPPIQGVALGTNDAYASAAHGCAVGTDGSVWCFGGNTLGQLGDGTLTTSQTPVRAMMPAPARAVALGGNHTCAVTDRGDVYCWGENSSGQLGDGTTDQHASPVPVAGIADVAEVAAHDDTTCARTTDGSVWCWGENDLGQLGAVSASSSPVPIRVEVPPAGSIAVGRGHACAVALDGVVWCWGTDLAGARGDRSPPLSVTAVSVVGLDAVDGITSAYDSTCAHRTDGTIWCWGSNLGAALGDGTLVDRASPVQVLAGASGVDMGVQHACAVLAGGGVACWGQNGSHEVSQDNATVIATPTTVSGIGEPIGLVVAGGDHSCALSSGNGDLWCWGLNAEGELGLGNNQPASVPTLTLYPAVTEVDLGGDLTCARTAAGAMWCSGRGNEGEMGIGTTADQQTPVQVSGLAAVTAIATGSSHSCAIANGAVWCWGDNAAGQLGIGTNRNSSSPRTTMLSGVAVEAGPDHTCARTGAGVVACWGANTNGQLGDGTLVSSPYPVIATELAGAVGLAVGRAHTCALLADGTVRCVGSFAAGQLGDGRIGGAAAPAPAEILCQ